MTVHLTEKYSDRIKAYFNWFVVIVIDNTL